MRTAAPVLTSSQQTSQTNSPLHRVHVCTHVCHRLCCCCTKYAKFTDLTRFFCAASRIARRSSSACLRLASRSRSRCSRSSCSRLSCSSRARHCCSRCFFASLWAAPEVVRLTLVLPSPSASLFCWCHHTYAVHAQTHTNIHAGAKQNEHAKWWWLRQQNLVFLLIFCYNAAQDVKRWPKISRAQNNRWHFGIDFHYSTLKISRATNMGFSDTTPRRTNNKWILHI